MLGLRANGGSIHRTSGLSDSDARSPAVAKDGREGSPSAVIRSKDACERCRIMPPPWVLTCSTGIGGLLTGRACSTSPRCSL